jgi:hypothetical protein
MVIEQEHVALSQHAIRLNTMPKWAKLDAELSLGPVQNTEKPESLTQTCGVSITREWFYAHLTQIVE